MIKITKNTRIIGYGCSHTAGGEAADHLVVGKPLEEVQRSKQEALDKCASTGSSAWLQWYDENMSPEKLGKETWNYWHDLTNEIHRKTYEENSRTWVRYLADDMGVGYLNRAKSGTGVEAQAAALLSDRHCNIIGPEDLIVICLPSIIRWMIWPISCDKAFSEKRPSRPMMSSTVIISWWLAHSTHHATPGADIMSPESKREMAEKVMTATGCMWNYISALNIIKNIVADRGNVLCFFSDIKKIREGFADRTAVDSIGSTYLNLLDDKHMLDIDGFFNYENHRTPETSYGFGHPLLEYQKDYAKKLHTAITTRKDYKDER